LDTSIEEEIATCVADPVTGDLVDRIFATALREYEDGNWWIPDDIRDDEYANNRPFLFFLTERFEWFSNVVPSMYSRENLANIDGLPPPPISLFPFKMQTFPFWNFRWDTADWGHKKWPAFPAWVSAFLGNDPAVAKSENVRNTVFSTNLEDRGPNNQRKKQYMSALTCDKLPLYEPKIDAMLENFFQDITTNAKPILSSWQQRVFELYFDLHLEGPTGHPDYVIEYIQLFTQILAPGRDEYAFTRRNDVLRGACLYPRVDAYFEERWQFIVDNEINSTFVFWWNKAGIPKEAILFEAAHNILAWGNLMNTLFLVVRAKLQGYLAIRNLLADPTVEQLDFFAKLKQANTENERLDVTREAYRLLAPVQFWLSKVERNGPGFNQGKVLEDDTFDFAQSILLAQVVQAINDDFNPLTLDTGYSVYDTSRYTDMQPGACPFANAEFLDASNLEDAFTVSDIDGETILPKSHQDFIPVFPAGQRELFGLFGKINGPKYCAFGLGCKSILVVAD